MKNKSVSYEKLIAGLNELFDRSEAMLLEFRYQQHYSIEHSGYCQAIVEVKDLVEHLVGEKKLKPRNNGQV